MSELDLDALEKLNAERTRESETDNTPLICECGNKEDARFIAAIANSFPALLRLARRAADAERERDEARYRVCAEIQARVMAETRLGTLREKCAPFLSLGAPWLTDDTQLWVRLRDLRELARAVKEGEDG